MAKHVCNLPSSNDSIYSMEVEKNTFRKIRNFFRGISLVSSWNPRTLTYFRSYTEIQYEKRRQIALKKLVIHPFSTFRIYFELVMIIVFIAHLIATPLDLYARVIYRTDMSETVRIYHGMSYFLCLIDIIVNCFTGYSIEETKEVVLDRTKILKNYLTSWVFIADVLSTVPVEFLLSDSITNKHKWIHIIYFARVFRVPTTILYMNNAADIWRISNFIYNCVRHTIFSVLIVHWSGCIGTLVSKYCHIYAPVKTQYNWIRQANLATRADRLKCFIKITFRTVGQLLCIHHGLYDNLTKEDQITTSLNFVVGYLLMGFMLSTHIECNGGANRSYIHK